MIVGEADNEPVRVVDFTDVKQSDQETFLEDHLLQHSARTFDPAAGAPFRITLFRLGEQKHILILTVHTLSCDEWSADIFCKEVTYLYAAFADGIQSALREIPVQYDEHVRRLNRLLQGQKLQEQVSYWDRRLKPPLQLIQLPIRRSLDTCPCWRAGSGELAFSPSLADKLKTLCKAEDATLLMLLIAGFMALLHRYTGEKDILVASQISGRDYPGTENSIGSFANTILLRGALSGQQRFLELLRRARNMTLEAYSHQDFPCELLLDKMGQGEQQSPMMLNLTAGPHVKMEFAGSEAHPIEIEAYAGKRDLVMSVVELPEGLVASCSVNRQLFDSEAIARLMRHLAVLLEDGVNNPGLPIGQLSLLTDAERHQLEIEWNDTQEEFATGACVHDLIEAQSDRTPDAVALTCENSHLTYRELDERANQVGRHLQRLGVRTESRVGVFSDRTLEMVIGLLGILKSGAAYLALDPAYPPERIAFMVDDAQASVILCQTDLVTYLPESEAQPVYLEAVCSAGIGESREKCPVNAGSNNAAYLIYTSGSTGSPKGVVIEHRSAVVFMQWARNVFGPDDLSGMLASTSICFDLSVFELFFPLSCGGKVILVENALSASELCLRQVSLINTGPSIMARMLKTDRLRGSVNTVNLAGEVLKSDLVQRIYAQGVRRVFNLYGPSEDTTYTTFSLIKDDAVGPPVIGRPISNSQIYLLDESHQPVPGGAPGELYIGGEGLARSYLDRPEITAEKFVPNPFGAKSGARLYKTGDLSRYLPDGNVNFIGRINHQVKIHGLRIELGEIEVVLARSQAVREAVVLARANDSPNDSEDSRLVAYVVPARTPAPTEAELRQYLVNKLPHYMVPSAFVIMTGLPLTPNGKVDRKALLEAEAGGETADEPFVGPRTPLEESLAKIWGDVLSRSPIGVRDNFFRLGGHSLLGARVISRVRDEWHVNLYLDALFRAPTVAEMAILITERRAEQGPKNDLSEILTELEELSEESATASEETIPLERVSREGALALSFAQERLWFFEQLEGSKGVYNCPKAVRVKGEFRVEAFEQAVREVIRRQESLQTVFPTEGGRPAQVIKWVERRWAEMVNLSELAGRGGGDSRTADDGGWKETF